MLTEIPPQLGSRRPADLARQAMLLRHLRKVDTRRRWTSPGCSPGASPTCSTVLQSDALRGLLSVSGVIGTWAGPRSAGTGYVTLHHHIGDADGQAGAWGFPRGGMGAVTRRWPRAARSFGAEIRTGAPVAGSDHAGGRVTGVTLASGEEVAAAS